MRTIKKEKNAHKKSMVTNQLISAKIVILHIVIYL